MKVLFITKNFEQVKNDGGSVVTKRNYELLLKLFGEENVDVEIVPAPNSFMKIVNLITLQDYGICLKQRKKLKKKVLNYDYVFFNSSLYGNLIKFCNTKKLKTVVYFHNVEYCYYYALYKFKKSLLSFVFCKYIKFIERKSCNNSLCKVVLNKRDSINLYSVYKINSDLIIPISMKPHFMGVENFLHLRNKCGFIGSNFFANQEGLKWFIDNVLPYINKKFVVAGSICEWIRNFYPNNELIEVVGYVEDLKDFYSNIDFIVSPIFSGSGMKTKSVEALSYGIPIIGTGEAFVGIESDKTGKLCSSSKEFIDAINSFDVTTYNRIGIKEYFNKNLSEDIIYEQLKVFFKV